MCGDKEQSTKPKEEPSIPASLGPTAALQKQELRKRWTPQSHPMQSPKKRKHPYIPRAEPHIQKALGGIRFDAQVCRKLLSNPARSDHIYIYIYIYIYIMKNIHQTTRHQQPYPSSLHQGTRISIITPALARAKGTEGRPCARTGVPSLGALVGLYRGLARIRASVVGSRNVPHVLEKPDTRLPDQNLMPFRPVLMQSMKWMYPEYPTTTSRQGTAAAVRLQLSAQGPARRDR